MKHTHLAAALLGSAFMIPTGALAHGPDATEPSPEGPLAIEANAADDAFVPAYLLAAVCGT
ncbi:MAG: hypothetical protein U9Q81_00205, partial [Pseudomonadota bacterium]|nr:hypothetical protein [Pseudomonadota bacterium]